MHALSRFDETPDRLVIDLTPDGYLAVGDESAVAHQTAKDRVIEVLNDAGQACLTMLEMVTRVGQPRTTIQEAVEALRNDGQVHQGGRGVRGDPIRFGIAQAARQSGVDRLADLLRSIGPQIDQLGELS